MAPAPSSINGSGLSIVSAIAEYLDQPINKSSGLSELPLLGQRISNRERLRLETLPTYTKQKRDSISNRENNAVSHIQPGHPHRSNSNRESLRLETLVTYRKQTPALRSNREIEALFQVTLKQPWSGRENAIPSPRKLPRNLKNTTTFPSILLRLKTTPILCFLRVTEHFNRTMLRLRRISIEPKFRPLSRLRASDPRAKPGPSLRESANSTARHMQERRPPSYYSYQAVP